MTDKAAAAELMLIAKRLHGAAGMLIDGKCTWDQLLEVMNDTIYDLRVTKKEVKP